MKQAFGLVKVDGVFYVRRYEGILLARFRNTVNLHGQSYGNT